MRNPGYLSFDGNPVYLSQPKALVIARNMVRGRPNMYAMVDIDPVTGVPLDPELRKGWLLWCIQEGKKLENGAAPDSIPLEAPPAEKAEQVAVAPPAQTPHRAGFGWHPHHMPAPTPEKAAAPPVQAQDLAEPQAPAPLPPASQTPPPVDPPAPPPAAPAPPAQVQQHPLVMPTGSQADFAAALKQVQPPVPMIPAALAAEVAAAQQAQGGQPAAAPQPKPRGKPGPKPKAKPAAQVQPELTGNRAERRLARQQLLAQNGQPAAAQSG